MNKIKKKGIFIYLYLYIYIFYVIHYFYILLYIVIYCYILLYIFFIYIIFHLTEGSGGGVGGGRKKCHVECYVYVKHSGILCLYKAIALGPPRTYKIYNTLRAFPPRSLVP